jgi:iron-sulfur cluster insertion protein
MIQLTDKAQEKIIELIKEENDPTLKLRVFVQGGGCSGFQYGFVLDNQDDEDIEVNSGLVSIVVDVMSAQYLQGTEIDFADDIMGAHFKIKNPNTKSTCGCGNSFSVYDWNI